MTPKLCLLNTQHDFQNQLIPKQLIRSVIALLTSDHLFSLFLTQSLGIMILTKIPGKPGMGS